MQDQSWALQEDTGALQRSSQSTDGRRGSSPSEATLNRKAVRPRVADIASKIDLSE